MKYLFFDIECSDGYHICSFGYVLVDEKMKIIEKDDIVINPESKFILAPKKSRPKIQLAYSEEYFYKQGNFANQYDDIKKILSRKNQIIFGHSIASDFRFLIYACQRYNLPIFVLEGFDTQNIYRVATNKPHVESLEKIVDELNIQTDFQYHKSSDDAHASFLVAKRLCKRFDIGIDELAKRYPECLVRTSDFDKKQFKERFSDRVEKIKARYIGQKVRGKIAFAEVFNKFKLENKFLIIEEIYKHGYEYVPNIKDCSIFVKGGENSNRLEYCMSLAESGKKIKVISLEELYSTLSINNLNN